MRISRKDLSFYLLYILFSKETNTKKDSSTPKIISTVFKISSNKKLKTLSVKRWKNMPI